MTTDIGLRGDMELLGGAGLLDVIAGTGDDDVLDGTAGADTITGLGGDDVINGRSGDDSLSGGVGDDGLVGGSGDDTIDGGRGQNTLMGGSGSDVLLVTNLAFETVDGGSGVDTASFANAARGVKVTLGDPSTNLLHSIENLTGSGFDDVLTAADNSRHVLDGAGGDDRLEAGAHTTLFGGDGADALYTTHVGAGAVFGDAGDDLIFAGSGFTADGGADNDTLTTWLNHGATITGGDGADRFVIGMLHTAPIPEAPEITDLTAEDVIDLSAVDANVYVKRDQAFTLVSALDGHAGEAALSYDSGANMTTLLLDTTGDGVADWTVLLDGDQTGFTNFVL